MKRFLLAFSGVLLSAFCCISSFTPSANAASNTVSFYRNISNQTTFNWTSVTSAGVQGQSVRSFAVYLPLNNLKGGYVTASGSFTVKNADEWISGTTPTYLYAGNFSAGNDVSCYLQNGASLNNYIITTTTSYNPSFTPQQFTVGTSVTISYNVQAQINNFTGLNTYMVCNIGNSKRDMITISGFNIRYQLVDSRYFLTSNVDMTGALNDLKNQMSQVNDSINSAADQAHQDSQAEIDAIKDQTQSIDNLESSITDPTIEGDFSVSAIQPFGPIGAITNAILAIPQTLLTLGDCSSITLNLPFVDESIILPCMSPILDSMAGPLITSIDVITSAYIWFVVAKYIFRKVQQLRDPQNDDEEYLDL